MQENKVQEITFWDHLDELRKVFFRIALIVVLLMVVAFLYKDTVFDIILAPRNSDFILYQWINRLGIWIGQPSIQVEPFDVELINIELASQFFIHMSTSFYVGILLASPYILYEIYRFVSPALYEKERNISVKVLLSASLLFLTGVLLNYFLIFPLSFRFLANYHVSELIDNKISISSYIDTFLALSVMLGATFEIPEKVPPAGFSGDSDCSRNHHPHHRYFHPAAGEYPHVRSLRTQYRRRKNDPRQNLPIPRRITLCRLSHLSINSPAPFSGIGVNTLKPFPIAE